MQLLFVMIEGYVTVLFVFFYGIQSNLCKTATHGTRANWLLYRGGYLIEVSPETKIKVGNHYLHLLTIDHCYCNKCPLLKRN